MKITPIDDDFQRAIDGTAGSSRDGSSRDWKRLKELAIKAAALRLIDANMVAYQRAIADQAAITPTKTPDDWMEWMRLSDEITRLFAEHDELTSIAFGEGLRGVLPRRQV